MLTPNEMRDRVERIWGASRFLSGKRVGEMWWITLSASGRASDTRGRNYSAHTLDGNGHAVCHDDCAQLELENCK